VFLDKNTPPGHGIPARAPVAHGYARTRPGCGAAFRGNASDGPAPPAADGSPVNGRSASCGTTVQAGNTVIGGEGLTNIAVTP
jgi:hypothetical protein